MLLTGPNHTQEQAPQWEGPLLPLGTTKAKQQILFLPLINSLKTKSLQKGIFKDEESEKFQSIYHWHCYFSKYSY